MPLVQAVGPIPISASSLAALPITIAATGAGNLLVVTVACAATGTNPTTSGVTLGGSATGWAAAATADNANGINADIWYNPGIAGGQTAVSVSFTGTTGTGYATGYVYEVSAASASLDQISATVNSTGGLAVTVSSGASPATTNPNEFWAGIATSFDTSSETITGPGSPWTDSTPELQSGSSFFLTTVSGYQIVSATGTATYAGTVPASAVWSAAVATFIAPSGSAPGPLLPQRFMAQRPVTVVTNAGWRGAQHSR